MRYNYLFLSGLLLTSTAFFAQNGDAENEVQKEVEANETKIKNVEQKLDKQLKHIEKQDEKIESYERALKMLESKPETEYKEITFHIKEAIGNKTGKTLVIKGVLVNESSDNFKIQAKTSDYFDNEGNQFSTRSVKLGDQKALETMPDVPVKFTLEFEPENLDATKITALRINIFEPENIREKASLEFKNIDIDWEE